jgi:hypothetical protein
MALGLAAARIAAKGCAIPQFYAVHADLIPSCDEDHSVRRVRHIPKCVRIGVGALAGAHTMACEAPYPLRGAAPACDTAQRLRRPIAAISRAEIPTPKRSETLLAERRATSAVANEVNASSEIAAKRSSSWRAARTAEEQELAALCQRRASRWGDAIRESLDPDIARFVRDQAAAWQLLATTYACSARDALAGPADAR